MRLAQVAQATHPLEIDGNRRCRSYPQRAGGSPRWDLGATEWPFVPARGGRGRGKNGRKRRSSSGHGCVGSALRNLGGGAASGARIWHVECATLEIPPLCARTTPAKAGVHAFCALKLDGPRDWDCAQPRCIGPSNPRRFFFQAIFPPRPGRETRGSSAARAASSEKEAFAATSLGCGSTCAALSEPEVSDEARNFSRRPCFGVCSGSFATAQRRFGTAACLL